MSESKQKIVSPKRSSLRNSTNNLNIKEYIIHKPQKRNSVSWNMGARSFNLDKIKANFEESNKGKTEKNYKFDNKRRESIKNEFTLVKEMFKNKAIEEIEIENDDEIKVNTEKNVEFGKNALNEKETDSESEKI